MRPPGGKLVDGRPGYFRRARMVCHCLLVETDDGLLLVDTGVGPKNTLPLPFLAITNPTLDIAETAARQVVQLGYKVDDVRHIALTHMDLDHAGGLRDFP